MPMSFLFFFPFRRISNVIKDLLVTDLQIQHNFIEIQTLNSFELKFSSVQCLASWSFSSSHYSFSFSSGERGSAGITGKAGPKGDRGDKGDKGNAPID